MEIAPSRGPRRIEPAVVRFWRLGRLAQFWLNDRGIDLGFGYLSESAWNIAGGKARGGTYAGQENLSLDVDWEKLAKVDGSP
jgi:carbohydrate-selective porin OprB